MKKEETKLFPQHEQLIKEAEERNKLGEKLHKTIDSLNILYTKATIRMIDDDLKKYEKELSPKFKRTKKYKDGIKFMLKCRKKYQAEVKNARK